MKAYYLGDDARDYMRDAYMFGTREKVIVGGETAIVALAAEIPIGAPLTIVLCAPELGNRGYVIERELYSSICGVLAKRLPCQSPEKG